LKNNYKINENIRATKVRLIDQDGSPHGIVDIKKALDLAVDASLDLIEVAPSSDPPVCKIGNYGKLKYEMQKKAAEAHKKRKKNITKEIKMSLNIGKGDYDTKIRHVEKFINEGDKVKVTIRPKGREINNRELMNEIVDNIINDTAEYSKLIDNPRMEGRQMAIFLIGK